MTSSGERLLTLRIPPQLKQAIKDYAKRKSTNVTQLTLDYYRFLLEQENEQEAEQI